MSFCAPPGMPFSAPPDCFQMPLSPQSYSAGRPAFQMLLCLDILFFSRKQVIGEKLLLHILKAKPCHSVGKPLSRNPLLAEQKDRFFYNSENFFFASSLSVNTLSRYLPCATFLPQRPPIYTRYPFV